MNPIFTVIERIAAGPIPDALDSPVLDFRNRRVLRERDLMEAILILGSIGKGKTTLAKTILLGMLWHGFGGLVLVVKGSQIGDIQELCRLVGREKDCLILAPGAGHVFNPIQDVTDIAEATELLVELSEILSPSTGGKGESESFWREQLVIILKNLLTLCHAVHGRFDLALTADLFDGRPATLATVSDPGWQQRSHLAKAITNLLRRPLPGRSFTLHAKNLGRHQTTQSLPCSLSKLVIKDGEVLGEQNRCHPELPEDGELSHEFSADSFLTLI